MLCHGEGERVWAGRGRVEKMAHARDEQQTNHFIDLLVAASERETRYLYIVLADRQ